MTESEAKCENYRAICLSSVVMKLYSRILENRLRKEIEENLEEEQSAFRPMRQTQDHIFTLRIDKILSTEKELYLAFIDLKSAIDRVPREQLWKALRDEGTLETLLKKIKCLYNKVTGVVRIGGTKSEDLKNK